jgi:site-specific DNA-cytosine methylase
MSTRVLGLFAGAGGAALGLHREGFKHVACVERHASA